MIMSLNWQVCLLPILSILWLPIYYTLVVICMSTALPVFALFCSKIRPKVMSKLDGFFDFANKLLCKRTYSLKILDYITIIFDAIS